MKKMSRLERGEGFSQEDNLGEQVPGRLNSKNRQAIGQEGATTSKRSQNNNGEEGVRTIMAWGFGGRPPRALLATEIFRFYCDQLVSKECYDVTSVLKRITLAVVLTENKLQGGAQARKRQGNLLGYCSIPGKMMVALILVYIYSTEPVLQSHLE